MISFLISVCAMAWAQDSTIDISKLNLKEGAYQMVSGDDEGCPGDNISVSFKKTDKGTDLFLGDNFVIPGIDTKEIKSVVLETECSESTEHVYNGKSLVQTSRHENCKDASNNLTNKITLTPLKSGFTLRVENYRPNKKVPFYKIFCTYKSSAKGETRNQ